ncbi:MAG: hypothetical protein AAB225_20320 [Acidobacteriota bacterium]
MWLRNADPPDAPDDGRLARLFAAYREACPDPEPDPNFMPRLWQRIEAQQFFARDLKRLAQGLVTAAVAVSLLMGVFLTRGETPVSFYTGTYVEILAANQADENHAETGFLPVAQDNL